ncbi:MAG: TerD family protein, partial [Patescibacteria group bacterium]|nr:TerD family protein [Patescibacteria group bacterium]
MTAITLNLTKQNETVQPIMLNLNKSETFRVSLSWDEGTDVDLHAILCFNSGAGAKVTQAEDILSAYNVERVIKGTKFGTLKLNSDGTFSIRNGAIIHSKDALDGNTSDDEDEFIVINPTLLSVPTGSVIEIPILAMIHPQNAGMKFSGVKNPVVKISDSNGQNLMTASLSSQF